MHFATDNKRLLQMRQTTFAGLALLMCFTLSWSNHAAARAPLPYHIEVIVFERNNSASELWSHNIVLAYPPNYRVIMPSMNTEDDASGEAISINNARTVNEIADSHYLLAPQAKKLRDKSTYRVLFHKAWEQTLGRKSQAPSIVINGGDLFDGKQELGGTIRFSVNKYIHVETDLWLSRFTPNLGQGSTWPPIPMAPTFSINAHHTDSRSLDRSGLGNDGSINLGETQTYQINHATADDSYSYRQPNSNLAQGFSTTQNDYVSNRIVTMKQSIRMRSKELNYLDHPVLGVLIKIVPSA